MKISKIKKPIIEFFLRHVQNKCRFLYLFAQERLSTIILPVDTPNGGFQSNLFPVKNLFFSKSNIFSKYGVPTSFVRFLNVKRDTKN